MNDEELNAVIMKADDEYDQMKDRIHRLYEENERLKNKMKTMSYSILYVKKEELGGVGEKFNKDLISIDDLISRIEDLYGEIDQLEEKIENIEQDKKDNWKPISKAEQYNVSEGWFH